MTTTAFAHGFTSTALLIMAIGAQNAFVLRQGLRREHVLPVVMVCALSDAVLLQAGVWGMGGVLAARPEWALFMRWAGAIFLVGYALQAGARALRPAHLLVSASGPGASLRTTLLTVTALTWLNPHVYLDTVVLLGTMASPYPTWGRAAFAVGGALASAAWFMALGFGARWLAPVFASPAAWRVLDAVTSATMMVLAGVMVLS
ncbi:MAG: LysE/ArgO family amino acid transporter [Acidovorax sp.]|jgi:L-lysine exporter family protein LysE/ArgO|uniref:LysE/ArgO family amino acid transporter n=1 Tax=Acidovorax sp. TaxID=1872122 RepID=UPI000A40A230|nr:LysE/ArgO family amino acid transporter [Acidovorax sp.]MDH4427669.1 LysE/ArgO family amino acid transporter [Acidovorax sp.]MDH4446151.1 LysE/ArgO family amino acid transporter [Acidovorax sp.]MDH4464086.1 LysE/ArgO family amino acid transporter [Acidovorax sp.]